MNVKSIQNQTGLPNKYYIQLARSKK